MVFVDYGLILQEPSSSLSGGDRSLCGWLNKRRPSHKRSRNAETAIHSRYLLGSKGAIIVKRLLHSVFATPLHNRFTLRVCGFDVQSVLTARGCFSPAMSVVDGVDLSLLTYSISTPAFEVIKSQAIVVA